MGFDKELDYLGRKRDLVIFYKKVFGSEEGKKVLEDMKLASGYTHGGFIADPHELAFKEGGRAFFIRTQNLINTDLDELDKKIIELQGQSGGQQ